METLRKPRRRIRSESLHSLEKLIEWKQKGIQPKLQPLFKSPLAGETN